MNVNWLLCLMLALSYEWTLFINAAKPASIKPTLHVAVQAKNNVNTQTHHVSKQTENAQFNKDIVQRSSGKPENLQTAELNANPLLNEVNELKPDAYKYTNWNPYNNLHFPYTFPIPSMFENFPTFTSASKMFPFFGFSQPIIVPFPLIMAQDTMQTSYGDTTTLADDTMSRTNARRPPTNSQNFQRNSPIYYMRLPPTPYMFLPGINYHNAPAFASLLPYATMPAFHAVPMSSMFDLPLNFLANGKPSGIYRIDDLQQSHVPFSATRPQLFSNPYRPLMSTLTPPPPAADVSDSQFGFSAPSPTTTASMPESKLTTLKRPYMFNGRPEDIFILPNNFNTPMYSETNFY